MKPDSSEGTGQAAAFLVRLVYVALVGVVGIIIFAVQYDHWKNAQVALVFSVAFMAAGAAWLAGGLLGFLFGIPYSARRANSEKEPEGGANKQEASSSEPKRESDYRSNTNLEQISDWLTKILVGVGLTKIGELPGELHKVAAYVASGMPECSGAEAFSLATIIYFSVCGFLFGFLWARLYLPKEYYLADLFTIGKRLDRLQKQQEAGVRALTLAQQHLDRERDDPAISISDLKAAIKDAPSGVKAQIFEQAKKARSRGRAELAAPVFEALVESDANNEFHRNHAQLAYTRSKLGDRVGAEQEIDQAIKIRDRLKKKGWVYYELKRAKYRIRLDPAFAKTPPQPSDPETRANIVADLRIVANSDHKDDLEGEPEIQDWIGVNAVQTSELEGSGRPPERDPD